MAIQDYCIGLKGAVNAIHRVTRALSGNVNSTTISDAVEEVAIAIENGGGGGGGGTTDHTKLQNRDSVDQHPISAITGLETELNGKANASSTYTKSEVDSSLATKQEKLQSGTNIKTINNTSLLGSGNIDIQGGGGDGNVFVIEYGQTPYSDIAAAIEAKKVILIHLDDTPNISSCISCQSPDTGYVDLDFIYTNGSTLYACSVSPDNTWTHRVLCVLNMLERTSDIGDISLLTTTDKANLVDAINEVNAKGGGIDFEVGVEKPYGTYTDGGTTYQVYSKVIYISALPSASGITNYPHGVTNIKQVLSMYGICTNGMVMNTPRQTTSDNIGIYQVQKSGNFAIEVGKDRSSIGAYVTMIYAKNN